MQQGWFKKEVEWENKVLWKKSKKIKICWEKNGYLKWFSSELKTNILQKKDAKKILGNNEFTIHRKRGISFIKPTLVKDYNIICNYCCQFVHMKNECYTRRNLRFGMKAMWMVRIDFHWLLWTQEWKGTK